MFISQTSSIAPLSCLKHALCTARKLPENIPKPPPGVLSGDISSPIYCVFCWWSDQLGCRLNVLGKVRRAQMKFGGGDTEWHTAAHTVQFQFCFGFNVAYVLTKSVHRTFAWNL